MLEIIASALAITVVIIATGKFRHENGYSKYSKHIAQ